jgi:hypothetical protein
MKKLMAEITFTFEDRLGRLAAQGSGECAR